MNSDTSQPSLSWSQLDLLDKACDEFEARWRSGERPSLAAHVDKTEPAARARLFRDLLVLDVEYRRRSGESPRRGDYTTEFGSYTAVIEDVWSAFETVHFDDGAKEGQETDQPQTTPGPAAPLGQPLPDERIGRFRPIAELGSGGFGTVYRAVDEDLEREVAIKIAHHSLPADPRSELELHEARVAASLDHPAIVTVLGSGRMDDGRLFIVSKLVEGTDLLSRIEDFSYEPEAAAELVVRIGEALHYAHGRGLIHRDIKPANILIDKDHRPFLTDFGLALRAEETGTGAQFAGSPAFMSPEQARMESHLVDKRSDIFSLSVVFYRMLAGQLPFQGDSREELLRQIREAAPRPPREINPQIAPELDRIVVKGLARRAGDRYQSAQAMVDDLRAWLENPAALGDVEQAPAGQLVVPKGLRAFDRNDAEFYVRLVPGPRNRAQIPEVIEFWQSKIEARDPDKTFRVGVLYGPSGSGKSSFVQAGLLPRLDPSIVCCRFRATPDDTEARWLHELRRRLPAISKQQSLTVAMRQLREGRLVSSEHKVLIIIDQFEQWLGAVDHWEASEVVAALRQCDGTHVQVLLSVRADYWFRLARCLRAVEVDLDSSNSRLSELFDRDHATSVLVEFGRAYGRLPDERSAETEEQRAFVNTVIGDMTAGGQIVPVRLALFADMFKDRAWTKAELAKAGGVEGVVSQLLDEIVFGDAAHPTLRKHGEATMQMLRTLLPASGSRIRGRPRSRDELATAAGIDDTTAAEILRVLDQEYRIVSTPRSMDEAGDGLQNQFSHDYLVPIVRDWVSRRQGSSFRERAQSLLDERTETWTAHRHRRNLPSPSEWLAIQTLTRRARRSEPAQRMLRAANRWYLSWISIAAIVLVGGVMLARDANRSNSVQQLVRQLATSELSEVPRFLDQLRAYPAKVVKSAVQQHRIGDPNSTNDWALDLALVPRLPVEASPRLVQAIVKANPDKLQIIHKELSGQPNDTQALGELQEALWQLLESEKSTEIERLRAAGILAGLASDDGRLKEHATLVVEGVLSSEALQFPDWIGLFHPIQAYLYDEFLAAFPDHEGRSERSLRATQAIATYYSDRPEKLVPAILAARPDQFRTLMPLLLAEPERQEEVADLLLRELSRDPEERAQSAGARPDPPELPTLPEEASGLVTPEFAFCQTLPLDQFEAVHEQLSDSGYQIRRFRPYADQSTKIAAIWIRSETPTHVKWGLSRYEVLGLDRVMAAQPMDTAEVGFLAKSGLPLGAVGALVAQRLIDAEMREPWRPIDTASYSSNGSLHFSAIWEKGDRRFGESLRVYDWMVPQPFTRHPMGAECIKTLHCSQDESGQMIYSVVVRETPGYGTSRSSDRWFAKLNLHPHALADIVGPVNAVLDVCVLPAATSASVRQGLEQRLKDVEKHLGEDRSYDDELAYRFRHALLLYKLDQFSKARDILNELEDPPSWHYRYRALANARIEGDVVEYQQAAMDDLHKFLASQGEPHLRTYVQTVVTECQRRDPCNLAEIEAEIADHRNDLLVFFGAVAFAEVADFWKHDPERSSAYRDAAVRLWQQSQKGNVFEFALSEHLDLLRLLEDQRGHLPETERNAFLPRECLHAVVRTTDDREQESVHAPPERVVEESLRRAESGWAPRAIATYKTTDAKSSTIVIWDRPLASPLERIRMSRHKANAALALVRMERFVQDVAGFLLDAEDPTIQNRVIALARECDVSADLWWEMASMTSDSGLRAIALQALHAYPRPASVEQQTLANWYCDAADNGVHSMVRLLLNKWNMGAVRSGLDEALLRRKDLEKRSWFVKALPSKDGESPQQITFAIIRGPVEMTMGSAQPTAWYEILHRRRIEHSFAISTTEITVAQFEKFRAYDGPSRGSPDAPATGLQWYDAARYCRWLSDQEENLDETQKIYPERAAIVPGMMLPSDYLTQTGYRLPSEAEWEYACRANSDTPWCCGEDVQLLPFFSWFRQSRDIGRVHPVAQMLPNRLGLFDMHGNAAEWTQDPPQLYSYHLGRRAWIDRSYAGQITSGGSRVQRGGAYNSTADGVRSAKRADADPEERSGGFRVVRTLVAGEWP